MPLIFIHGVNTRQTDKDYAATVAARDELFRRRLLRPLASVDARFAEMSIVNPYWGGHGVTLAWNGLSIPDPSDEEYLGPDEATVEWDALFTDSVRQLAEHGAPVNAGVEALGSESAGESDLLLRAAQADLTRFLEHVLTPVLLSEYNVAPDHAAADMEGQARALLAIACADVAADPRVQAEVNTSVSDETVVAMLADAVIVRLDALRSAAGPDQATPPDAEVEELGSGLFDDIRDRTRELFTRTLGAPGRIASLPVLRLTRERLNHRLTRFLGDVFVYLNERGTAGSEGQIIATVRDAIASAARTAGEPLIVVTHSMGGNIFYDLLTHFWPTLTVDAWISVGGQIGQFEEMKIFHASDKGIKAPSKVGGLRKRLRYWLNVYDPADALSFRVKPVFHDVNADVAYYTGVSALKAHGEYFGRASFYDLVRGRLEKVIEPA